MSTSKEILEEIESLQNLLVSVATGGVEQDADYLRLRQAVLSYCVSAPRFLKTCRNLAQFWQFIKFEFPSYAERRDYLWNQFRPMLEAVEYELHSPSDPGIAETIANFDSENIRGTWVKALERRSNDPEGAITAARTLLESVCKHILDESKIEYGDAPDINKLYRLTAEQLNIAPSQHTEPVFKQILGGCTSVVEGLGALRNRLSDSHGQGRVSAKPSARHAELAVNLAGTLATFLISTWESRKS